jgi:23S rRNA pseudouridine1911/1915/1917 synthase
LNSVHGIIKTACPAAEPEPDEFAPDEIEPGAESETRTLAAPAQLHGQRLDKALAQLVPEFSRNYLQQLIAQGCARVNGVVVARTAHKLRAGDRLAIELRPTPISQAFVPQSMDLVVVHEDEHILVIDKPAGLVVHPAPGHWSGTLLNGLLARDTRAAQLPRAGIVHRLDKDTSGLMVVARTRAAMDVLVRRIAARAVHREYLAIAHRRWHGLPVREVDAPIGRDPRQRLRMAVIASGRASAKPAQTRIELLANGAGAGTGTGADADACLVRCVLGTGRTHQIRVHMAYIGHPLASDVLYGGAPLAGLTRQALHARRLTLAHPVTDTALTFESVPPADLRSAAAQLGWASIQFPDEYCGRSAHP